MGNPSLSAPEPNESVWYAEASPSPEIGRKQTLLEDKKGWDKDLFSFKSRRKWKGSFENAILQVQFQQVRFESPTTSERAFSGTSHYSSKREIPST
ncbi:hypothetical protein Lal_00038476 [Lupinus albus]|nr:hypothetical protein Lal_00038476 [Lupinus albus]